MRKEDGVLVLNEGIYLKYIWGKNLYRATKRFLNRSDIVTGWKDTEPDFPKNLCSLFWGNFLIPLSFIWAIVTIIFAFCMMVVAILVVTVMIVVGFSFGYVFNKTKDVKGFFHPYCRYGENNKKKLPIAPWWIWVPALIAYFVHTNFVTNKENLAWLSEVVEFSIANLVSFLPYLFGCIALFLMTLFIYRKKVLLVVWEFLKAKKKKMCPLVRVEPKG